MSSTFRSLLATFEADYGRIASSAIQGLSDARQSAALLLCISFNILLIATVAVICVSGYGFAMGLGVVVYALAPALMLLNIALFAWVDEGWQPSPLHSVSTSTQASQSGETLDEKNPSIAPGASATPNAQASQSGETLDEKNPSLAPEASATPNTQASQSGETLDEKNPSIVPGASETPNTQVSDRAGLKHLRLRLGPEARREIAKWMKIRGT